MRNKSVVFLLLFLTLVSFLIRRDSPPYYIDIDTNYNVNFSADFDYVQKKWLVLYEKGYDIRGQFVNLDFTNPGASFSVPGLGCSATDMCFDPYVKFGCYGGTCKFIISFVRSNTVYYNIFDQNMNNLLPNPVSLSVSPATQPYIDFDHINGRFLIVFSELSTKSGYDINGFLVNFSDGATIGGKTLISGALGDQIKPSVAFSESASYIVVWQDHRADNLGDVYYQLIAVDGSRIGENSGVGLFPGRREVNPYVFWLPSIQRFVVLYKTESRKPKPGESAICPTINGNVTCDQGHYVYSLVNLNGTVSFPQIIVTSANLFSETEHYARMGTDYILLAGDSYYSLDKRRHIVIMKFDSTNPKFLVSNPTFWFPDDYSIKVGLIPTPESFCPPARNSETDSLITVEPSSFVLEEKKTKTSFPTLFARSLNPDDYSAKTFVSASTYPGINTAIAIFGDYTINKLRVVMKDDNPLMFDYNYFDETTLPVAVTNTCYISYGSPPCSGTYQINVTGGKSPYSFQAVAGQMPPGLTLNSSGSITGFVSPIPINSICDPYPCPFTFSVLVSDSSNPKKYSCMTFDILLFPAPEVRLDYPSEISFCTKSGETKSENVFIRNLGTPVTIQILEPKMISFGDQATCSTPKIYPLSCSPYGSSISPFYLEIYSQQSTVGNGCPDLPSCLLGQTCDCREFKYELYPGESIIGILYFSASYGDYTTRITFHVEDSILGYSESHTINVRGIVISPDIFVMSDSNISPSGCTNYGNKCTTYLISLPQMYVGQSTNIFIHFGNAATSSSALGCPSDVFLDLLTVYVQPNPNFQVINPPLSEFNTLEPISIPNNTTATVVLQASGVFPGPSSQKILVYSDDPDETKVYVYLNAYFLPVTLSVPSIVDCGLNLKSAPAVPCFVEIQNQTPVSAIVQGINISGSSAFYVVGSTNFVVPPFSTYPLQISFGSPITGVHIGVITLNLNSYFTASGLKGQIVDQDGVVTIDPSSLDFGLTLTGASVRANVKFINMTLYDLYVSPIYIDFPFAFPSASSELITGGSNRSFVIDFIPTSEGTFSSSAIFRIFSSRFSFFLTYPVSGTAVRPESIGLTSSVMMVPNFIDFGKIIVCSPKKCPFSVRTLNIVNVGNVPVDLVSYFMPSMISNYSISTPLRITDFYQTDFIAKALYLGEMTGSIDFSFSSTAGSFSSRVTFYLNGVSPSILVSPTNISFPTVKVGDESIYMISISNTGNWKLTVTGISVDPPFLSDVPIPFEVQPGELKKIPISFIPKDVSDYVGYVSIFSDAPYLEVVTITLSGSASENPLPVADISPTSIDFGKVKMGTTKSDAIRIKNIGTSRLYLSSISSFSRDFKLDSWYAPYLDAGQSLTLPVVFSPSSEGLIESYVLIRTNDADKPEVRVLLKGEGANPHIRVPSKVDFGGVRRGKTVKKDFPVENTGNLPLQVELSFEADDEFSFFSEYLGEASSPFSLTIPEKSSSKIEISFTPSGLEKYRGTITIRSDDPEYPYLEIPVSGEGGFPVLSMDTKEIDFGQIYIDEKKEYSLNIGNIGNAPLEVTLYVIDENFSVSATTFVVPPQENYVVNVIFTPNGKEGIFSSSIKMLTDDPKNLEVDIIVKGSSKRFSFIPVGSGCSCSSVSFVSFDWLIFVIFGVLFWKFRSSLLVLFVFFVITSVSYANTSINLNYFYPYQDISDFSFVRISDTRAKKTIGWGGYFSFAKDPLMLEIRKGQQTLSKQILVNYMIYSGLMLSYVPIENLELSSFIPVSIVGGAEREFGLSDIFLEAKYNLFNDINLFSFSVNPQVGLPGFGGEFSTNRSFIPRLGFILSRDFKVGQISIKPSGNFGFEYRTEGTIADLKFGSQAFFILGSSLKFRQVSFSVENISFVSLEDIRKETFPSEVLLSFGGEFSDLKFRAGGGSGLTQGIGSPKYRFFILFSYDIQPSIPPIRYIEVRGKVLDETGTEVQKGIVYVDELGVSSRIEGGKFEMELPEGKWTFKTVSPGYETKSQSFVVPKEKPEMVLKKIPAQVIFVSTDRFGIPQSVDMNIKTQEGVLKTSSDIAAISVHGNIEVQIQNLSKSVVLSNDEILWLNLVLKEESMKEKTKTVFQEKQEKQKPSKKQATKKLATEEKKVVAQAHKESKFPEILDSEKKEEEQKEDGSSDIPKRQESGKSLEPEKSEKSRVEQFIQKEEKDVSKELQESESKPLESKSLESKLKASDSKADESDLKQSNLQESKSSKLELKDQSGTVKEEFAESRGIRPSKVKEKVLESKSFISGKSSERTEFSQQLKSPEIEEKTLESVKQPKTEVAVLEKRLERVSELQTKKEVSIYPMKEEERREIEEKLTLLVSRIFDSFKVNKWDVPRSAYQDLDKISQIILENKDKISGIRIEGHTDITGPEDWNVELSYLRANEVRRQLYKRGVKIPIEIIGYNYLRPVASNDTEEGRRKNRRTEVKVFSLEE